MTRIEEIIAESWRLPTAEVVARIKATAPDVSGAEILAAFEAMARRMRAGVDFLDRLERSARFVGWPEAATLGEELRRGRARGAVEATVILAAFPKAAKAGRLKP